ncbi:MAG: DUF2089 family protein [Candidatus Omnitrophota bacterium]
MMRLTECPICKEKLKVKKMECFKCGIGFEGEFYTTPVISLPEEQQCFIELFVLASGSLKEMAGILGITYPTVRNRLDEIIGNLKQELKKREDYKQELLKKVEEGKLDPEKAADIIRNL